MLELNNLCIGYKGHPLVSGITAHAPTRSLTMLVGRNGSGKSTLLRTLCGLLPPVSGSVRINGVELGRLSHAERAAQLSLVLAQQSVDTTLTVCEVVALGTWPRHTPAHDDRVMALLEQFKLVELAHRRLDQISDGERQKTMIARALMQDTPLIVMDEPTAFLDLPSRMEWWQQLNLLRDAGKTLVISTHDLYRPQGAPQPDAFWVLHKQSGSFQEFGSHMNGDALLEVVK